MSSRGSRSKPRRQGFSGRLSAGADSLLCSAAGESRIHASVYAGACVAELTAPDSYHCLRIAHA